MATITTTERRRFKKRRDGQITPVYEGSIGSYSNIASGVTSIIGGYGIKSTGGTDPTLSFDGTELDVDEDGQLWGATPYLLFTSGIETERRLVSDIGLSSFNNDAGFITGGTFVQSVLGVGAIEVTGTANVTVSFDAGNWAPMGGALFDTDYILVYDTDADLSTRKRIRDIQLSKFNNDEGWTANGGTMNNWFINTDHPSATKRSVQEDGEVFLIGGTGIELSAVTENIPQQRWELTISATSLSPWSTDTNGITYTAGNVGIGVASNSSYDLRVAGTVYFDSKLLVSGGGDNFQLYAGATADHVYMEFFADSAAQTTRSGYFGFPSAGATQMIVRNQMSGGTLQLQSDGEVIMQPGTSSVSRIRYGSSDRIVATSAGVEISGILDIERIGQSISLKSGAASSSSYMGFYKGVLNDGTTTDPTNTTRNAYFGYASGANNDFNLYNEIANSNTMIRGGSGTGSVRLYAGSTLMQYSLAAAHYWYIAGTAELALDSNTLYPNTDLGLSLGTSSKKWNNLYVNHIYAEGAVEAYDTSDMRFKTVIESLDRSETADAILGLSTFRYTWKDESRVRLGLSAQEVQKVFPENVKADNEGTLMIHYGKLIPALIATIQRQQEQIDELKNRMMRNVIL
jgi:hypothetical protein